MTWTPSLGSTSQGQRGALASVQILRAVAALTVVFGHAQQAALLAAHEAGVDFTRLNLLPWGAGVDLFFVISGFIMVYASERLFAREGAAREFLTRRLIRIAPLYWAVLAVYVALHGALGAAEHTGVITPLSVAASYAFVPYDTFHNGIPQPVYALGWTLNYEMLFYCLFAAFIAHPRFGAVARVAAALAALVLLGAWAAPAGAPARAWTQPIVLEFALGMGIALMMRAGAVMPLGARFVLAAVALLVLFLDPMGSSTRPENWITPNDLARVVAWGLPAAALMAAVTLGGGMWRPTGRVAALGVLLGDASYALYLTHPFVVAAAQRLGRVLHVAGGAGAWALFGGELALCAAVAILIHEKAERPLMRRLSEAARGRALAASVS